MFDVVSMWNDIRQYAKINVGTVHRRKITQLNRFRSRKCEFNADGLRKFYLEQNKEVI